MKTAIIGSGGREHALGWKLAQGCDAGDLFFVPGNGGTGNNVPLDPKDFDGIRHFCREQRIELILVGPEQPLVDGIVDFFRDSGILVLGPDKAAARLEGSKIWSKQFMKRHGVATADFWIIDEDADFERTVEEFEGNIVLKYDGLAAGKGVKVCSSPAEARDALEALRDKYGRRARVLAEEKLSGQEISIIGFTDGQTVKMLLPSQDHKPVYEGDQGPNTGGMGAYCPVPFCDEALLEQIRRSVVDPTLEGIQAEGIHYKGVLYFGLMVTDDGPRVLEYNVRLGDPESEVVLPSLETDLGALIRACFDGTLGEIQLAFNPGYYVDVVLASGGYPGSYETGHEIKGLDQLSSDTLVFHAGTSLDQGRLVTSGGRVLNVVSSANTLRGAIEEVYRECANLTFQGVYFRKDIGRKGLGAG
jgi:phosphoribosylamine--glycine ligase